MTGEADLLARLQSHNPFSSNAAGDPRAARYPDVPGLGDDLFQALQALFTRKKEEPHKPCAAAVLGEAGSGKTHLIGRLIKQSRSAAFPYAFAYLLPFIDPGQGFRYLLREIINNLTYTHALGGANTQFEFLAGEIAIKVLTAASEEAQSEAIRKRALSFRDAPANILKCRFIPPFMRADLVQYGRDHLLQRNPELHPAFLKVLLQYCFEKSKRPAAQQWLMGRVIDADDSRRLGVSDRSGLAASQLEQEAQEMLASLDLLLHLHARPLIIFFDQLENLHDADQIKKFQSMVFFLSDIRKAMLPVAFFRAQDWERKFKLQFDDFCSGRFKANLYDLKGCNRAQGIALIRARLELALGDMEPPNPMYPFYPGYEDKLHQRLRAHEMHPRQVITRANGLLLEILGGQASDADSRETVLKKALDARINEIRADIQRWRPDKEQLALALELYLANRPDIYPFHLADITPAEVSGNFTFLQGRLMRPRRKAVPAGFIIDTETHHTTVAASLRHGINFLYEQPDAKAVYVRDGRCPFRGPRHWKKNNELLETFLEMGGCKLVLEETDAAVWYALMRLQFDVRAGDVSAPGGGPIRSTHLHGFIAAVVDGDAYPALGRLDGCLDS